MSTRTQNARILKEIEYLAGQVDSLGESMDLAIQVAPEMLPLRLRGAETRPPDL